MRDAIGKDPFGRSKNAHVRFVGYPKTPAVEDQKDQRHRYKQKDAANCNHCASTGVSGCLNERVMVARKEGREEEEEEDKLIVFVNATAAAVEIPFSFFWNHST